MDLVSVIIVNYNCGPVLTDTVTRIIRSSQPVEIFVVDNGSSDNSIQLLREKHGISEQLFIIENGVNLGFSAGNNIALRHVKGKFLLFLNPDCFVNNDTIQSMLGHFDCNPNIGMAGCLILNEDGTEQAGCRRYIPKPWQSLMRVLNMQKIFPHLALFEDFNLTGSPLPHAPQEIEAISGAFMLIRKSAMDIVGIWDEGYFLHCEDLDLCMRFHLAGFKILFVPNVIVTHKQGSCSSSRPVFVEWHKHKGMVRFYRKFFKDGYPAPLLWLVTLAVYSRFTIKAIYLSLRNLR